VVLFEPAYDAYLPLVRQAGGVPRLVKLSPPDWRFDPLYWRELTTMAAAQTT